MSTTTLERVMYVDDDADIRKVAKISLELVGKFELCLCESGHAAIAEAGRFKPELILLDVMMPGMDGPTTLARLREIEATASSPVVFVTAKAQAAEIRRYRELGAVDVVTKPFQPMKLPDRLRDLWQQCRAEFGWAQEDNAMNESSQHLGFLRELTWDHIVVALVVLIGCSLLSMAVRWIVRRAAESAASHRRLLILRTAPIARLLIWIGGITIIVPLLIEPTFEKVVALAATLGLALAFAIKDYVSCVIAGIATVVENVYQPGDRIELDGSYGEVKAIGTRAVHIVTSDDTEVIIPHSKLWSSSVFNASGGKRSLLCVTDFYLRADHDGACVRRVLSEIAEISSYRKPETPVKVVVAELPWGTRYKIKAYVNDSREQFAMITDLTIRGKERLRTIGVVFAHAPYAEQGHN